MNEKRMIDINELREELGFAEQCENCKQNEWHCQRDCYYSLKDFCEKLDIAIETILERHNDTLEMKHGESRSPSNALRLQCTFSMRFTLFRTSYTALSET